MAEAIELPLGVVGWVGLRKHAFEDPDPSMGRSNFFWKGEQGGAM